MGLFHRGLVCMVGMFDLIDDGVGEMADGWMDGFTYARYFSGCDGNRQPRAR